MDVCTMEIPPPAADEVIVPWRPVRFFLATESDHAERFARRLRETSDTPVRVVCCGGRGLRVETGDDERRADVPVENDRRGRPPRPVH